MNLSDIRVNIDRVDKEIKQLFIERMALAEQVVSVKAETGDKIFKPDREKDIIERNSQGMNTKIEHEYQALVKRIMEVSRKYQYGRMLELRDCFPYKYETEEIKPQTIVYLKGQEESARLYKASSYVEAESYEKMGEMINTGQADAGVTIMQAIGRGVSEGFHQLLCNDSFYINDCIVTEGAHPGKCILFSKHLTVLAEHNRFKVMFICHNHTGSFGTLLSMISDYGVNVTEIHSSPFKEGEGWNYHFFLELSGNMGTDDMHSLIFQLSEESEEFKLLGSYHCVGDFL